MSACARNCDEFQDRDHEADVADRRGHRCFRLDRRTCRRDRYEHLFGFTIGTDVGELGEKELESNLAVAPGKRAGSYSALPQALSLEYTANQNLRLEVSAVGAYHDILRPGT
jgi:hypothetical protein